MPGNPLMVKGGPSLNPHGRPKGFAGVARQIMRETRDGAELVEWALALWRDVNVSPPMRMAAFEWLSDRGLGKPVQMTELGPPGSFDEDAVARAEALTDEQLDALVELDRRKAAILAGVPALLPSGQVQNPKVLDGASTSSPAPVALLPSSTDEE